MNMCTRPFATRRLCYGTWALLAALATGCAHPLSHSPALGRAQAALERAKQSSATEHAPEQLERAGETLALAQQACDQHKTRRACGDLAYVAQRQAQLAIAVSGHHEAQAHHGRAMAAYARKEHMAPQDAAARLVHGRHKHVQGQMDIERALAQLGTQLPWKHDHRRGLVLAVPHGQLFANDDTHPRTTAKAHLDKMAASLKGAQVTRVRIHSAGPAHLAAARAQHLRQALLERGVHHATLEVAQTGASSLRPDTPGTWHLVVAQLHHVAK